VSLKRRPVKVPGPTIDRDPAASRTAPPAREDAWGAFGLVASGVFVWGGAGWLVSQWLDNRLFVMLGLLLGMFGGLYLVWFRYGRT
jgi:ATP synthase protein I